MAREQANSRFAIRLGGFVLLIAVAVGGVLGYWFYRPPSKVDQASAIEFAVPYLVEEVSVQSSPSDAREVCRELIRRHQNPEFQTQPERNDALLARVSGSPATTAEFDNQPDSSIDYAHDIRPILVDHCYRCHGPDRQEAGIRFDRRETVFRVAESGSIPVIPGNVAHSEILARVAGNEPKERMPLGAPPLSAAEISRLQQWISAGAAWSVGLQHWAFIKPQAVRPPDVADKSWSRNGVDDFVSARLAAERLSPSPAADRTTLIRRLSLDLIGLPPTPAEVDEFDADSAPDAYERLVDRLLASPHFGEKWAIRWLDLARFADTNGFEFDAVRMMWLYRDWVIDSLNQDLPFDQFTVEQIAGDLLPNGTVQQRVATGFLRNSAVAPDIGTHRFDMLVDRVNALGTTWFGLTFSCAQCHHHKFDPLTQQEYYQLYAILNNSVDEVAGANYEGTVVTVRSPLNGVEASTLVLAERSAPIVTFLKVRGSPAVDGEQVQPGFPRFLHAPRCGESDRLALACWLIDDDNPLTARVTVNRLWESLFGIGLVRTSDDFGIRGEHPSHPELLDWLAVDFQRGAWSSKCLIRRLISSATYRQSTRLSDELRERDPQNRLLARGPRFRVDAELIRDVALSASGLLSRNLGGPSVFPWQPPGTSEKLEFAGFSWQVNPDENRYRRGLYTHWKRTALYPSLTMFDAPNRTGTCPRRDNSTTPLQALVSLNDPVFFEAAVHLGRRMLDDSDGSAAAAITRGIRLCVGRHPTSAEASLLLALHQEELNRLSNDVDAAVAMLGGENVLAHNPPRIIPVWAAYTTVANVLLSLDETMTKE